VALSFFGGFVIVYNELTNNCMGRLDLDFGGIDCEFEGLSQWRSQRKKFGGAKCLILDE